MEEKLQEFEIEEHEKFDEYLQQFLDEALTKDESYPVVFGSNPYYDLEMNSINHIGFSVADNPFFKMINEKYYPEAIVINEQGVILARISGSS